MIIRNITHTYILLRLLRVVPMCMWLRLTTGDQVNCLGVVPGEDGFYLSQQLLRTNL